MKVNEWNFVDKFVPDEKLRSICVSWLSEVSREIMSRAMSNTPRGKVSGGSTIMQWATTEDKQNLVAYVGNPSIVAVWLELGTGDYAVNKDGRKGGWYILVGNGDNMISPAVVDAYHMKRYYGKDGKVYVHTYGMRPRRMLQKAYESFKDVARARLSYLIETAQEAQE